MMKTKQRKPRSKVNPGIVTMPFGKYSGMDINEIETAYLVYAWENFSMEPDLLMKIEIVLQKRLSAIFFRHISPN